MNDKRQCYGVLIGAAGGLLLGVFLAHLWSTGHPQASILFATLIVLTATLVGVFWYAAAAHRQAEILKDQFDVQYRPHLRPGVAGQNNSYVCIRLANLSGVEAIEPGVYPGWKREHRRNGRLLAVPDPVLPDARVDPAEEDDFATCDVLAVGEEVGWWVERPKPGESWDVRVRWGQHPWENRHEHIWRLAHSTAPGKEHELHFEPPRD